MRGMEPWEAIAAPFGDLYPVDELHLTTAKADSNLVRLIPSKMVLTWYSVNRFSYCEISLASL